MKLKQPKWHPIEQHFIDQTRGPLDLRIKDHLGNNLWDGFSYSLWIILWNDLTGQLRRVLRKEAR